MPEKNIVANPLPSPEAPLEEPTTPVPPLDAPDDQAAPEVVTATGVATGAEPEARAQQGAFLTTAQGVRITDTDHSLKAGRRGPTLLQDHHLREKITHFDHERIPERAVHARGVGAHGTFVSNGAAAKITKAAFLQPGVETPVFVRFSTVLGSRGSADTPRDTRGFAVKFYTTEGNYDFVGNNMPVFFIQDGIKFPDIIHAGKPEPDLEMPQAASAHDTFWDFVSLHTEAQHHTIWNMSDRALVHSLRMMEGFGVHTFRFIAADGQSCLVKFHWKPKEGVNSQLWEEAQLTMGSDADFHRRDLSDAIEAGHFPQWDLGVQVLPDTEDQMFEGIDLLDPTKLVPEELAPVQIIGTMTLNGNPTNFFAETEQVAFHPGHLVPGIDVTNDPLLQARLFSYLDTQITRLGGPNFAQLPINRPLVDVNDNQRDGFHQDGVHAGKAPYRPNSLGGGCPFHAGLDEAAFIDFPAPVAESVKERGNPATFDDHFTQPRMFFRSLTAVEQSHVVNGYAFELSKVTHPAIRERQVAHLVLIDESLGSQVAAKLGIPTPAPTDGKQVSDMAPSPALAQIGKGDFPVAGRRVGVVAAEDTDADLLQNLVDELHKEELSVLLIGPHAGEVALKGGTFRADKPIFGCRSIEFDALIVTAEMKAPQAPVLVAECFRHAKPLASATAGKPLFQAAGAALEAPGVTVSDDACEIVSGVVAGLRRHRVWQRLETH